MFCSSVSKGLKVTMKCLTFCDPEEALRLMDERLNEPLVPLLPLLSMLSRFSCPPYSSSASISSVSSCLLCFFCPLPNLASPPGSLSPPSSVFSVSSVSCLLLLLPSLPSPPGSLSPLSLPHLCFLTVYSACPVSSCAVVFAAVMHSGVCGEMSLPIPSHSSVIRISGRCSLMDGGLINAD